MKKVARRLEVLRETVGMLQGTGWGGAMQGGLQTSACITCPQNTCPDNPFPP